MSKIGKINIAIPDKVKVALNGSVLNVDGPLGKKSLNIDLNIFDLKINDGKEISLKPKKIDQDTIIINSDVGSNKELEIDKIKTTNVNVLLNRVRLDQRRTLKKRIIFSIFLASLVSSLAVYFII